MITKPQFAISLSRPRRTFNPHNSSNAKAWVVKAITEEGKNPPDRMWKKELSAEKISNEQLKRIRFLRKHGRKDPALIVIADCLDRCENRNRCWHHAEVVSAISGRRLSPRFRSPWACAATPGFSVPSGNSPNSTAPRSTTN